MIIALNNKSNLDKEEFIKYNEQLEKINTSHTLILCPSTINIPLSSHNNYELGAQNISIYQTGAHTGEVNPTQLYSHGVKYVIVGHSERRMEEHERNEEINKKIKRALDCNIIPILCVGESRVEREKGLYKDVLSVEINVAMRDLTETDKAKIIIAYEPIWSIGTGIIPTTDQIDEAFAYIKEFLPNNKILYGGSANEENIEELNKCNYIDGYLLGGLSLKPENLQEFINRIKD